MLSDQFATTVAMKVTLKNLGEIHKLFLSSSIPSSELFA